MMEKPLWQRIIYSFWPKTRRIITEILFFIYMILRTGFKIAKNQIKKLYYYDDE